jgi:hypothetical protein
VGEWPAAGAPRRHHRHNPAGAGASQRGAARQPVHHVEEAQVESRQALNKGFTNSPFAKLAELKK